MYKGGKVMYQSIRKYVFESTDDELIEFFNTVSKEDWIIPFNWAVQEKYPDEYVYKYFLFRGLLLETKSSGEILDYLKIIISKNEKAWNDYISGNDKVIGRFLGLLIKEYKVDPKLAKETIEDYKQYLHKS